MGLVPSHLIYTRCFKATSGGPDYTVLSFNLTTRFGTDYNYKERRRLQSKAGPTSYGPAARYG